MATAFIATRNAFGFGIAAVLAASATAAPGQAGQPQPAAQTDDIIVTASRRSDRLIDVPQSVQVLGGETIERIAAASLQDVVNQLSGVTGFATGTGKARFNIRGLQSVSGGVIDSATVGYYLDETPLASAAITPDVILEDLERIEVLKGPQGTLYGEGSLGGTIRLVTRQPVLGRLEAGLFGEVAGTRDGDASGRVSGVVNLPVADWGALRVVGSWLNLGGFIDDATSGERNVNGSELSNLRTLFRIVPADGLDLQFGWVRQRASGGPEPFQAPGEDRALRQAFPQVFSDRFDLGTATLRWRGEAVEVVYAGSRYVRQRRELRDERSSTLLLEAFFGFPFNAGLEEDTVSPERTWTHELRVLSTGDGPFRWLVGGFHKNRRVGLQSTSFAPDLEALLPGLGDVFSIDIATRFLETAAFGEVSYTLADAIRVTGGARYFRQTYRGTTRSTLIGVDDETGLPIINDTEAQSISQETSKPLFKLGLDWKPSDDSIVYALFSQGVRGGGVNTRLFLPEIPRTYGPDRANSFELGARYVAPGQRLSLGVSLFRIDWFDLQVPIVPAEGIDFIVNAGRARSQGVELEGSLTPARGLRVGGTFSLVDATLREPVSLAPPGSEASVVVPAGSRLPQVARESFSLFSELDGPIASGLDGFARLDLTHVGARQSGLPIAVDGVVAEPATRLPAYTLVNLRAGVTRGPLELALFAENLFDQRALLATSTPDVEGFLINRPRTIGINARLRFPGR
ncbi:MAG: TonB-dependent receptor [Thermaurantiacus sp.]